MNSNLNAWTNIRLNYVYVIYNYSFDLKYMSTIKNVFKFMYKIDENAYKLTEMFTRTQTMTLTYK